MVSIVRNWLYCNGSRRDMEVDVVNDPLNVKDEWLLAKIILYIKGCYLVCLVSSVTISDNFGNNHCNDHLVNLFGGDSS